jgi:hypothetical protein
VGVKAENLRPVAQGGDQLALDVQTAPDTAETAPSSSEMTAAEHAADVVRARFGSTAVGFGSLLRPSSERSGKS